MSIIEGTEDVKKAAELIGITTGRLRQMIRAYNKRCPSRRSSPLESECRAEKFESPMFAAGHVWQVPTSEIKRIRDIPKEGRGGMPRIGNRKAARNRKSI